MTNTNLEKLKNLMNEHRFDTVALIPGSDFRWLTGMEKHLMERPTMILVTVDKDPAIVAAGFEMNSFDRIGFNFRAFPFSDNPSEWGNAFRQAGEYLDLSGKTITVNSLHFRFFETELLEDAIANCRIVSGESLFKKLRLQKTEEEISFMKKAAIIAETALEKTLKIVRPGISEHEIASELNAQLMRAGSDPALPFSPIVAGGPNAADPHAAVSDRILESGDFLLFDWGARYQGYCSDITRTFAVGDVSEIQHEVYNTVLAANRAAKRTAHPGIPCGAVDRAARTEIEKAGYGSYFTHRLGHGLGMEAHEDPYIYAENSLLLSKGMVFTDEPGIYLPGKFGVRIEDDLVITNEGCEQITSFPRELRIL